MGTSGSYSGSGGKAGKNLRQEVDDWLNEQPDTPGDHEQPPPEQERPEPERPPLKPETLLHAVDLLGPRAPRRGGGDGPGGGGGGGGGEGRTGGGPRRSVGRSAGTAGRAAAAAYAFATGDAAALAQLGLDFDQLRALADPAEVARRIVEATCGKSTSTIEDHEQRLIAGEVAEWILAETHDGTGPAPEEIARQAIAIVIANTTLVETAATTGKHEKGALAESEIRDAAEALAGRATLSANGATEAELTRAIRSGIETLRKIAKGGS